MGSSKFKNLNLAPAEVDVEHSSDGAMILRSPHSLGAYPNGLSVWLIEWAERTPEAIFIADRTGVDGGWRRITYKDFLANVRSIGQFLLSRGLNHAFELARQLGKLLDIPVSANGLQRRRHTQTQTGLA